MIELARAKTPADGAQSGFGRAVFVVGDMSALPFPEASFDVVTTGYGLRNVPDLAGAVREIARVLRPHGVFLSLDFNRPSPRLVRAVYHAYLSAVGGALGWALHGDADTYRYIPESIRLYPGAPAVVELLRASGFAAARWRRVLGGLMALHEAERE
jgi:demethylmenaquinone methyltransferase / 2-methoxy-6-polyprenyl-1,4-benzoquinol methylase